jgi:hypothetical protein
MNCEIPLWIGAWSPWVVMREEGARRTKLHFSDHDMKCRDVIGDHQLQEKCLISDQMEIKRRQRVLRPLPVECRLFIELTDIWTGVGAWNCNREDELDCAREDEESQLPERVRNLCITPSDDDHCG